MAKTPDYGCPKCNGRLADTILAGWKCSNCGVLIKEKGGELRVLVEPDQHGSRVETYKRNHAEEGQHHE